MIHAYPTFAEGAARAADARALEQLGDARARRAARCALGSRSRGRWRARGDDAQGRRSGGVRRRGSGAPVTELTDGERWTRAALARGRAAGWRPRVVAVFLAAARERSAQDRRARPELTRRSRRWSAAGAGAWIAGAALAPGPLRRRVVPGLASWAATAALLDWHLGMVQTPAGVPRPLGAADAATLARVWLAPLAAERAAPAALIAGFATDVADGRLARRSAPTRFGRDFDGQADAVFVAAALLGARRAGHRSGGLLVLAGIAASAAAMRSRTPVVTLRA